MTPIKNNKSSVIGNKTLLLTTATKIGLILLILFILYDFGRYLKDIEEALIEQEIESQKMKLSSEMMELARSRTRITSKIIDTIDAFEQDSFNMELESYAARFSALRQELLSLPLSAEELDIIDSHNKIVPVILPAQRFVVELAMEQTLESTTKAKYLFYSVVLPGQEEMITSFGRLISIEQQRITELTERASKSIHSMSERNERILFLVIFLAIPLAALIVMRIHMIQNTLRRTHLDLERSHNDLELKVKDRTRELSELNKSLQHVSEIDELTDLGNRRKFNSFMQKEYDRTNRAGACMAVMLIDIDYFKQYNDIYGHLEGDRCLAAVATAMKECLPRAGDFIARYGGEEFVVVLPATDLHGGKKVAQMLLQCIADINIAHAGSKVAPHVTASLGVVSYCANDSISINEIMLKTDKCLYEAKSRGRNTVVSMSSDDEFDLGD